jgi:repressor LexA
MYQTEFTTKEIEAIKHIRNYLSHKGRTPSIRKLMRLLKSKSIKSTQDILFVLNEKGIIQKFEDGTYKLILDPNFGPSRAQTLNIPVVGVIACGSPIFAEQNIEGYIPISTAIAKPGHRYFLLHAKGDSMNEAGINDGDLVLIKQQNTAQEGEYVVALIDDEATIKEFHKMNDVVVLRPKSTNPMHKAIILEEDFQVQGIVEKVIPDIG